MGRPKKSKYQLEGEWINSEEDKEANKLFTDYLEANHFDRQSDVELLKRLVFAVMFSKRLEKEITKKFIDAEGSDTKASTNYQLNNAYTNSLKQIMDLQKELGMLGDKSKTNPLEYIFRLLKKFKLWKENNQDGREITCCHCAKIMFLNIRTDRYEAKKHPYFIGKILGNPEVWRWYKEGKITKEEFAKAFNTSTFYIDWIEEQLSQGKLKQK